MYCAPEAGEKISEREMQVWKLLANGHNAESVANTLRLSIRTVRCYENKLSHKLGIVHTGGIQSKLTRMWIERYEKCS